MKITKSQIRQIIKEELLSLKEGREPTAHQAKVLDTINHAADLIARAARDAEGDEDLTNHLISMVQELHRLFGEKERETPGI